MCELRGQLNPQTENGLLQDLDDHVHVHIVVHWNCIFVTLLCSHSEIRWTLVCEVDDLSASAIQIKREVQVAV